MSNFKIERHQWVNTKCFSWAYCGGCGLVRLRNERTSLAMKLGCNYKESQEYIRFDKQSRRNIL
jgi:hypothetical protein